MSKTKISWTDETANWIVGCSKISQGCRSCYAATAANSARLQQFPQYQKVVDGKGNWNGHVEFVPKVLDDLLKGKRSRRVFAPSMSDPFHPEVKDEWLIHFLATVALTPHITYQLLTKRANRMLEKLGNLEHKQKIFEKVNEIDPLGKLKVIRCPNGWPFPNLHIGITAENQTTANDRIPYLEKLAMMGFTTFVSVEPMLEDINLMPAFVNVSEQHNRETGEKRLVSIYENNAVISSEEILTNYGCTAPSRKKGISQVIIGGESGPNSRIFYLERAKSLIDQCLECGVKVFMKQVGSNAWYEGNPFKPKSRAGTDPTEWPEWARIQEFPG